MIKIHGVDLSPFVRKVLLTLEYKNVEYQLVPAYPGDSSPGFAAISPLRKIPVLEHDGFTVPDSSVICRYLDDVFGDPSIYPEDPRERASACWLEEFADTRLMECCAGGIFFERFLKPNLRNEPTDEEKVRDTIENQLPPLLGYLEGLARESGPLVGDAPSIADIAVTSAFATARWGDYQVDAAAYPKLGGYLERAFATPVMVARHEAEVAFAKSMSG